MVENLITITILAIFLGLGHLVLFVVQINLTNPKPQVSIKSLAHLTLTTIIIYLLLMLITILT